MYNQKSLLGYKTVERIKDPIVVAKGLGAAYGDVVVVSQNGIERTGRVIGIDDDFYTLEMFGGVSELNRNAVVRNTMEPFTFPFSDLLLGRILDGKGKSKDDRPDVYSGIEKDVNGTILNPYYRKVPDKMIETGITSIDLLNTLVMGQKLAVFSSPGTPILEMLMQMMGQSIVNSGKRFIVVFAGIGLSHDEEHIILQKLSEFNIKNSSVLFLNSISDPLEEAILTPRIALTAAEHFAFEKGYDVLAMIGDMTNYADVLRNISSVKEELTTRQGYPSYLFSDFASMYERCGTLGGKKGSITLLPFLSMPNDDITHPVPDTSGYISEGQIIFSKEEYSKGIYPPIDILNSLSRMMHFAITKEHTDISNKVYNAYAEGKKFEEIASMMGMDVLDEKAKQYVSMKEKADEQLITQDVNENRKLKDSIKIAKNIL